jgi:hypothetical protein
MVLMVWPQCILGSSYVFATLIFTKLTLDKRQNYQTFVAINGTVMLTTPSSRVGTAGSAPQFVTLVLDGNDWSASGSAPFTAGKIIPGLRAGLDAVETRKIS